MNAATIIDIKTRRPKALGLEANTFEDQRILRDLINLLENGGNVHITSLEDETKAIHSFTIVNRTED